MLAVLWCRSCGFGWRDPFPTHQELRRLYSDQPVYGLNYRNESQGGFPLRLKRLSRLMPRRGRLLDIGSGLGYFLNTARNDGWEVEGLEPRSDAVRFCYEQFGIRVREGFLENMECRSGVYDVVTLWDVFEHVSDHIRFLEQCIDLLVPGGILVLAIPNASGWPARIFRERWRYIMATHLNYFTMRYIEQLLSARHMTIERADHTIKVHSLVQGVVSWLPFDVPLNRIFRIGSIPEGKHTDRNISGDPVTAPPRMRGPLHRTRKMAFKLNMVPLPWGIGDMVDLYCRKLP